MILARILFIFFCFNEISATENESCRTPNQQNGKCVKLKNCSPLLSLTQNVTNDVRDLLRRSKCGQSDDGKPLVCCPEASNKNTESLDFSCMTPKSEQGICKTFKECDHLYKIYENQPISLENKQLIRASQCGKTNDGKIMVCCPLEGQTTTEAPVITTATSLNNVENIDGMSCQNHHGETGKCIKFKNCEKLFQIFKNKPISTKNREFLSKSQCGLKDSVPYVCCPNDSEYKQDTHVMIEEVSEPDDWLKFLKEMLPSPPNCGMSEINKIFGGEVADIKEHPWVVLLEYEKSNNKSGFHCGGSLISDRYVLTAAHCTERIPKTWTLKNIRIGEWNTKTDPDCDEDDICAPKVVNREIEETIPHFDYRRVFPDQHFDITLIRLKEKVTFNSFVQPLCLALDPTLWNKNYMHHNFDVAGWGRTESSQRSEIKMKVSVPFYPQDECSESYAAENVKREIVTTQICAGGIEAEDSCNGDSGGPLMIYNANALPPYWYQVGIVSAGPRDCGTGGMPGIYTKVSSFLEWIAQNIRE